MKNTLIYSIVSIVLLTILFVIHDCKELYSGNKTPVLEDTAIMEEMSITQSAQDDDLVIVKDIDKSIASQTNITTSVSHKTVSAVIESADEKQSAIIEKEAPAAIPVVTAEEAEKLNEEAKEFALAEKERREPFFRLYQNSKLETICFERTVRTTSTIPDPEKNDYDNCLYTLFVEIDSILSNVTKDNKISCEAILSVPIMKGRTVLQENVFLPGDKICCTCAEYDVMPQGIQEIQISDDIQSYEHQQYYALGIKKISAFSKGGNRNFAKREITILPIQSLPKDEKAAALRKERIQKEISRIEKEIQKHGGSFEKWKEEYKPTGEKYKQLAKESYSCWINDAFFAAGGNETTYQTQEYIKGILPYKQYLSENNIDLIIVRVPSKWDFAARVLASDDFQENPAWVEHYYECLKKDIEIVDPMPAMWEHRFDYPLFYFYQDTNEIHPFEGYSFVTSQVLASRLERYEFDKTSASKIILKEVSLFGKEKRFLWPEGNSKFDPEKNLTIKGVYDQEFEKPIFCKESTGSPFLLISNSLFLFPSRSKGAGFPEYLAYNIHVFPDFIYREGQRNSMLRSIVSHSETLSNRKALIMCGGFHMWNAFPLFPKYLTQKVHRLSFEKALDFSSEEVAVVSNLKDKINKSTNSIAIPQEVNSFSICFPIDEIKKKHGCMIRVIFSDIYRASIQIFDEDSNAVIESYCEVDGNNKTFDGFLSFDDDIENMIKRIRLDFKTSSNSYTKISKIELWYY